MGKRLKRIICFMAAFALAFVAVKPISVKAYANFRDNFKITMNQDGSISAQDANGQVTTPREGGRWELRLVNPTTDSGVAIIKELGVNQPLSGFDWIEELTNAGYAPVVGKTYRGYLREYVGDSSIDYDISVTYTGAAAQATYTVAFDSNGGSSVTTQTVNAGSKPVKPTSTREGYELAGWYLSEVEYGEGGTDVNPDPFSSENYNFDNVNFERGGDSVKGYTFKAKWTEAAELNEPKEHKVLEGGDQTITKGSGQDLVVRVEGDKADCAGVFVNGEEVEATLTDGSTIVTIKAALLDKMNAGTYKLTVAFGDGAANTTFILKAAEEKTTEATTEATTAATTEATPATVVTTEATSASTSTTASPKTADATPIAMMSAVMLISLAGIVTGLRRKEK